MRPRAVAALLLMCTACGGTRLPERRPADFSISVSTFGGMLPEGSQTRCDGTACAWSSRANGVEVPEQSRPVTATQLDGLYAVVRGQAFDRIRLEKHEVMYDGGGINVLVTADGKTYSLGNDATSSIASADEGRYEAVIDAVKSLVDSLRAGTSTPPVAGRCDNQEVHGTCTFSAITVIDPATGAPLPPDAPPGPDGTLVYAVRYTPPAGVDADVFGRVRARPADRATLESFYEAHPTASCDGIIVRPPCPPSVDVSVQMPPPPVGAVVDR
ncbi:MAG TPA: hypothetical protein VMI75_28610 [Polyangiaceae bacterium]|nr:hypothetical protein [Polyangiaceae bacterium]